MKKIICFDSWTGGARHYQRLIPAMRDNSIRLTLVHISSWGNNPSSPPECNLGDLLVRDISFYGNSLENVIATERPDAAILLSTETFAHRAFMRYCKLNGVPTLHLSHGVESVFGQSGNQLGVPKRSKIAHIGYVASKLYKLLTLTLPCYSKSLMKTGATFHEWKRFASDIYQLAIGNEPACVHASADAKATYSAVYISADAMHAKSCFGYEDNEVFVVGNPDLHYFGFNEDMIGRWSRPDSNAKKYVMYIETGLSSQATLYAGTSGFVRHLLDTSFALSNQGYKLRLKLKPDQVNTDEIIAGILGSEIDLVSNENFLQSLQECVACISETSTLALTPALMGMPLLLANYGDLSTLSFGSVLTSYPRGYLLKDISEVTDILDGDLSFSKIEELGAWISENAGPLPFNDMPQRVVSVVNRMLETVMIP